MERANESSRLPGTKLGQFQGSGRPSGLLLPSPDNTVPPPSGHRTHSWRQPQSVYLNRPGTQGSFHTSLPHRPGAPCSRNFRGLVGCPLLSPGSLGRVCPASRLCSRGAASGSFLAPATRASKLRARRSGPAALRSPPRTRPVPPLRQLRWASRSGSGRHLRDPGGGGSRPSAPVAGGGGGGGGRAARAAGGAPARCAGGRGGRRVQLCAFAAAGRPCACARRGDGARGWAGCE